MNTRLVLALVVSGAVALTACGGGTTKDNAGQQTGGATNSAKADPNAKIKEGLKITFLPKQVNNPYFTVAQKGAEQAGTALKAEVKATGPSDAAASSQVTYINTAAQQQQNALVISANDANAVAPALKSARSQGLKVVTFDSDAAPDARDVFINQATSNEIAAGQVKLISEAIGGSGEIAILSATPNATNQNAWIALMKKDRAAFDAAVVKWMNITDKAAQDRMYEEIELPEKPYPSVDGIRATFVLYDSPEMRKYKPEDFYDSSIMTELDRSGFIDRLYR